MKGKASWTRWAALRDGVSRDNWAGEWLQCLTAENLPSEDYILYATNVTMDAWILRAARYADFSRALHLLLMAHCSESPDTVVEFTPHGCRHSQITAAQQLAQQGHLSVSCLESLGHWERGSRMPKHYDAAACVTELQARRKAALALKKGWRPARDGEFPEQVNLDNDEDRDLVNISFNIDGAADEDVRTNKSVVVLNTLRKKLHLNIPPALKTKCVWWQCGEASKPSEHARFNATGNSGKWCRNCFI